VPPTPHDDLVSPLTYTEIPPFQAPLSSIFFDSNKSQVFWVNRLNDFVHWFRTPALLCESRQRSWNIVGNVTCLELSLFLSV